MHTPSPNRYAAMRYNRCGASGLKLPAVSLGLWQNFGDLRPYADSANMVTGAFDLGITHFDLANNYGPPPGTAEITMGRILRDELSAHRDELVISSKAGYHMWEGPYGEWGSKKHLVASCEQSLKRLGLHYLDIFYHHRPDPETPLEETMDALCHLRRQGKILYIGISNYGADAAKRAAAILKENGAGLLIHQPRYNIFDRRPETEGLFDVLREEKVGAICFSPLAQGLLTSRYFGGIPAESRVGTGSQFLRPDAITPQTVEKAKKLGDIAAARGQSLAQMALSWTLRDPVVTSTLIGASRLSQIEENIAAIEKAVFTKEELDAIDAVVQ